MKKVSIAFLLTLAITFVLTGCGIFSASDGDVSETKPGILMFLGSKEDLNCGELYFQEINGEKDLVASTAIKDEYVLAPKTHSVLVLNKNNELYLKTANDKVKVANDVKRASYMFSEDEQTVAFLSYSDAAKTSCDLYIQRIGQDKEKITSGMSKDASKSDYKLSDKAETVMFRNAENNLYKWTAESDKEKVASNVKLFNTFSNLTSYTFLNNDNNYYIKFANDTEAQRISATDIGSLKVSDDGLLAIYTSGYNWEKGYGELYALLKNSDPIKIASNVKSFVLAENGNLYYLNDESSLYLKELPKVKEDSYKNASKFSDTVRDCEKMKLGSSVSRLEISANGKNCAFVDNDGNLFICYDKNEKVKVASDVTTLRVFDSSLLFVNKDKQMFLNSRINANPDVKENNNMIAQLITNFSAVGDGKYISFSTSDSNSLKMITDGKEPEEIVQDCNDYDIIVIQSQKTFEKKLLLDDIVGIYKNTALGVAYKITNDKQFVIYEKGAEKEKSTLNVIGINRISAELKSDDKDSVLAKSNYAISVSADGKTKVLTVGDTPYTLTSIDEAGLTAELERQKKAEADAKAAAERKAAAEKAAAELKARKANAESRARDYYYNDVYVTSYETLYYSPNYNSASGSTFNNSHWATVYDYQVSSDGWTIWLEVYSSNEGYFWIAR